MKALVILLAACLLAGCGREQRQATPPGEPGAAIEDEAKVRAEEPPEKPAEDILDKLLEGPVDVVFETSKGTFEVRVHPEWAPRGARRFLELVQSGFYDGCRFFRIVRNFVAQVGINGDPAVHGKWQGQPIEDDPVVKSNLRGYVTFAMSGPNSRTTQVFFNYRASKNLDGQGFAPFGVVLGEGMEILDALNSEYGQSPVQGRIVAEGNAYLEREFPNLDYIKRAYVK